MTVAVRFAPSPTGWLHVGNVRAALLNWLFARKHGGTFMLRLDDTDRDRSRPEYAAGIEEDLTWLGLAWDDFSRQSDRPTRYAEAMAQLIDAGRLYPCYETPEELELKRKTRSMRGLPPIYDRAALDLTADDRAKLEQQGRRPHWRFKLDHRDIVWNDLIRGEVRMPGDAVSDPVLVRADGVFLYTFGSVVDDVDFGITHVIRGEDHVTNTSVQIQIFEALGATPPAFAHFTLFTDITGHGFSKREGSLSVRMLREEGIEPLALDSYLAKLGSSDPIEPRVSLDDLVAGFDLSKFHRGGSPKFDVDELRRVNARLLHALPFDAVRDRLPGDVDESFWDSVRPNLERLTDIEDWRRIAHGPVQPVIDDREFAGQAAALLPDEPYDAATFKAWADAVKIATGRKGKELFLPLRRALTGMDHGPEMAQMLPLIGRDRALRRLGGEAA